MSAAPLKPGTIGLAGLFVASGVLHFVRPKPFERIMPPALPAHRELVYASGAAELACAAGLAVPATRRVAGWASAAVLVGVFPANIQAALGATAAARRAPGDRRAAAIAGIAVARLPLQWPMIRAALDATR